MEDRVSVSRLPRIPRLHPPRSLRLKAMLVFAFALLFSNYTLQPVLMRRSHAAETNVIRSRAGLTFTTGARHIAGAVLFRAQKRSSLLHALCYAWFARIKAVHRSLRIANHCAGCRDLLVVIGAIPICAPLPDVSGHVGEA